MRLICRQSVAAAGHYRARRIGRRATSIEGSTGHDVPGQHYPVTIPATISEAELMQRTGLTQRIRRGFASGTDSHWEAAL